MRRATHVSSTSRKRPLERRRRKRLAALTLTLIMLAVLLPLVIASPAGAALQCVNDTAGANDVPGKET